MYSFLLANVRERPCLEAPFHYFHILQNLKRRLAVAKLHPFSPEVKAFYYALYATGGGLDDGKRPEKALQGKMAALLFKNRLFQMGGIWSRGDFLSKLCATYETHLNIFRVSPCRSTYIAPF